MSEVTAQSAVEPRQRRLRFGPLHGGGLWGVLTVVLAYLALSIPRMGERYVIDEAVFPYVAEGILKHGAPFYYNGELRPADFGLWHPPLYDYVLAGFVGIFGFTPVSVRSFGLVCVVLSLIVFVLVLRRIMPNASQAIYVVFSALVLLNPLVISGALIPDIDGSLGFLVVALGFWLAVVVKQEALSPRLFLLTVGFATLSVATKFTISGFIALVIGIAALMSTTHRWRKFFAMVGGFIAGTALALGLLVLAGALIGFDARLPFDYLFSSLGARTPGRGGVSGAIAALFEGPGAGLVWIGPALIIAAIVSAILISVRRPATVDSRLVVLATVSGLVILIGYAFISASPFQFPKYTPIVVPALALAATALLSLLPQRPLATVPRPRLLWVGTAYTAVLLVGTAGIFLIARRSERVDHRELSDLFLLSAAAFAGVLIATSIALVVLRVRHAESASRSVRETVAAALLISLLATPIMVQTATAAVNLTVPYATRYYYGERGMDAFIAEADAIIPPGDAIIGPKDIGFQLPRPFYEDALLFAEPVDEFREFVETKQVPYVVTRDTHDYSESIYPKYFAVIREFYEPVIDNPDSDFVLWRLKVE